MAILREGLCVKRIPCRYIVGVMCFLGVVLQVAMKANVTVAIVAMVKRNVSSSARSEPLMNASCPVTHPPSNTTVQAGGDFAWDGVVQGYILSSYFYGYLLSQLLGGYLAERIGGRYVFGPGIFLGGVFSLLCPVAANINIYFFIVLRALTGFTSGVVFPSVQVMISRWFHPDEQTKISAFIMTGFSAGALLGTALTGVLVKGLGWTMAFYFFGGLAVVWFVPWMWLVYSSPDDDPRVSQEEKEYILAGYGKQLDKKAPQRTPWLDIFTSLPVWAYIAYNVGVLWIAYTMFSELPTYLNTILHFDVQDSGFISALPHLSGWICGSFFGWLSQKLKTKGVASKITIYRILNGCGSILASVFLVSITFVGCDSVSVIILFVLVTTANSCVYGGSIMNNIDLARNFAGTIVGINSTITTVVGILTPTVVGYLTKNASTREQWAKVFYIAAGVACSLYCFFLAFATTEEQKWNRQSEESKIENDPETEGQTKSNK